MDAEQAGVGVEHGEGGPCGGDMLDDAGSPFVGKRLSWLEVVDEVELLGCESEVEEPAAGHCWALLEVDPADGLAFTDPFGGGDGSKPTLE